MLVKAKQGGKCPKENAPREYIDEDGAEVPETAYYLRLLSDGSLEKVSSSAFPLPQGEGAGVRVGPEDNPSTPSTQSTESTGSNSANKKGGKQS